MRAIIETVFDIFYLVTVLTVGIRMIRSSKSGSQFKLFGLMAVVLGAGDSFHLVPRALALCTTGLENYAVPLGLSKWITNKTPLAWGILRNIPFALLGLLVIVLFYHSAKEHSDRAFRWMWLTIVLSFGFYIPVVLWAEVNPLLGMLMIPKTCAYVWTVLIGYNAMKAEGGAEN